MPIPFLIALVTLAEQAVSESVSANSILNFLGGASFLSGVLALIPKLLAHQARMRAVEDKARELMATRFENELARLADTFQKSLEGMNAAQNERVKGIRSDMTAATERTFTVINNNTAAFNKLVQLIGPKIADPTTPTFVAPPR